MESAGSTHKNRDWEALASGILQGNILPRISNSSRLRASLVSKRWLKACSTSVVTKPGTCFVKLYRKGLEGFIIDEIQIHSPLQGEWYSGERVGWVGERNFECNGQALHGGQNGLVFVWRWPGGADRATWGIEVVVYNPLDRSTRRDLPFLDALCPDFLHMVPRAAQGGKEYSIVAIRRELTYLAIFHSWTGSWRWCIARPTLARDFKIQGNMRSSMDGKMVCLLGADVESGPPWRVRNPSIWSLDMEGDEWTEVAIIPDKLLKPVEDCLDLTLVGGTGRILLVITKGFCMKVEEPEDEDEEEEEEEDEDEEDEEDDEEERSNKKVKRLKYNGCVSTVEVWELLYFDDPSRIPAWVCLSKMPTEYVRFMDGAFEMECNRMNETSLWGKNQFDSISILDAEGCIYFCFDATGHCNRLVLFDPIERSWHWLDRCPREFPDCYQFPHVKLFTMKPDKDAKP